MGHEVEGAWAFTSIGAHDRLPAGWIPGSTTRHGAPGTPAVKASMLTSPAAAAASARSMVVADALGADHGV